MPSLAAPLKKWIADCKAYAAKHGCSYKEAMSALKKSRKRGHGQRGGGVADQASSLEGFALEGMSNDPSAAGAPSAAAHPAAATHPSTAAASHSAGAPPPPGNGPQTGGQPMFEAGAVAQTQSGGRRRRRSRGFNRKSRSHSRSHSRSQSRSQNGGRRHRSRRRSSRGGSGSLSYSQY